MGLPSRKKVLTFALLALVVCALMLGGPGHAVFHMDDAGGDCDACYVAAMQASAPALVPTIDEVEPDQIAEFQQPLIPTRAWAQAPPRAPPVG